MRRLRGNVRPDQQGKPSGSVLDTHSDFILGVLEDTLDTTLDELLARLAAGLSPLSGRQSVSSSTGAI
jgi:hypothetical protein